MTDPTTRLREIVEAANRSAENNAAERFDACADRLARAVADPAFVEKVAGILGSPICDATGEEHQVMRDKQYAFCTACGETVRKPAFTVREANNYAKAVLSLLAAHALGE